MHPTRTPRRVAGSRRLPRDGAARPPEGGDVHGVRRAGRCPVHDRRIVGDIELLNKRTFRLTALGAAAILVVSACSSSGSSAAPGGSGGSMDDLITAAKAEGTLTTIALPHDWCNYGEAIDGFKAKYGLEVNELNPDAGSGDEIEAIKANKDNKGPQAPDVIDVGCRFGPQSSGGGLVQPYKVATWDTIPAESRIPTATGTATTTACWPSRSTRTPSRTCPQDWADLLKPEYKGQVALAGDPRASTQAIQMSVYAAALANGGSLDNAQPGLEFFKKLNEAGNFVPGHRQAGHRRPGRDPGDRCAGTTTRWRMRDQPWPATRRSTS